MTIDQTTQGDDSIDHLAKAVGVRAADIRLAYDRFANPPCTEPGCVFTFRHLASVCLPWNITRRLRTQPARKHAQRFRDAANAMPR